MAFSPVWDDTDPLSSNPIAQGATEIQDTKKAVALRVDTVLSDGAAPSIPATISDLDTRFATDVNPMIIKGSQVDLRGMTHRLHGPVTQNLLVNATGSFVNVPSLQLIITPVSSNSLLVFHLEGAATLFSNNVWNNDGGQKGQTRVFNTTDTVAVSPTVAHQNFTSAVLNNTGFWLTDVFGPLTGISAATTFDLQIAQVFSVSASLAFVLRGTVEPTRFYCIEYV